MTRFYVALALPAFLLLGGCGSKAPAPPPAPVVIADIEAAADAAAVVLEQSPDAKVREWATAADKGIVCAQGTSDAAVVNRCLAPILGMAGMNDTELAAVAGLSATIQVILRHYPVSQ